MQSNTAERGHVLLIAGDAARHRREVQLHPSANLAALSVLSPSTLIGSRIPTDVVYLDGVRDQNTLLVWLRAAAAVRGPVLIYLSGRLTTDHRSHQLHLATTSTSALNSRYTALPWEWIHNELRNRPPGRTTLLLDLVADKAAWTRLQGGLPPVNADTFGIISPPNRPGANGASPYTQNLVEQFQKNPERSSNAQLHALAVTAAAPSAEIFVLSEGPHIQSTSGPMMTNAQRILTGDVSLLASRRTLSESAGDGQAKRL
ncbi:hypothetical protein [Streptomyces sp. NPDC056549]|uniref:hypothetical protein n=1 Tax=Streptomyces sp. NPDC056549 TaxID=3345864 RepID=UPI003680D629